jgi:hypothetical protein
MSDIQALVKMLHSNDADKRYDACEQLRVSPQLPPEALEELRALLHDKNADVADAARRAIELHTSDIPQQEERQETILAPHLLFWNNRKKKLWTLFFMVVAVFILTLPWSVFSVFLFPILFFPAGLIGLVGDYNKYANLIYPLWAIYLGLATLMVLNNKKKVVVGALIVLILLLLLNITGCHVIGPSMTSGIS